jgi:nicotinate phosphoribosyltransferase
MNDINYTMLCDFYELKWATANFLSGLHQKITYFDVFFREVPDGGGFAIAAGLEQVIEYIQNLHFDKKDIEYTA